MPVGGSGGGWVLHSCCFSSLGLQTNVRELKVPPCRAEAKAPPRLSAHGQPLSFSVVTTLFLHLLLLDRYQQPFPI